jgi:hypothetical protein
MGISNRTFEAEIDVQLRSKSNRHEVKNTLLWYDPVEKKMLTFVGGGLTQEYDPARGRMYPKVLTVYASSPAFTANRGEIESWVALNQDEFGLDLVDKDERSVTILFPEFVTEGKSKIDNRSRVESALYAARFRWQIREHVKSSSSR